MKKRFGFTLAEVLITLGIIGVVAAMTIPSLIQNTASVRNASQFKKNLATLTNAVEMAQAHQGIGNIAELNQACNSPANDTLDVDDADNHMNSICGLMNVTLNGVRYIDTVANAYPDGSQPLAAQFGNIDPAAYEVYSLPDGSWIAVNPAAKNGNARGANACRVNPGEDPGTILGARALAACRGFIDVNGAAGTGLAPTCNNAASPVATTAAAQQACVVRPADVHDVFPILFHDGTVSPGSAAAAVILSRAR